MNNATRHATGSASAGQRVLAIAGSLRRDSWNRRLLEAAAERAPAGMTVQVYRDLASIPVFDEDLERDNGGGPEAIHRLRSEVIAADALLVATPEYNQSMPGALKNVIDWLSRPAPRPVLAGKPVAVIGASSGRWGTRLAQHAVRQALCATESRVMPAPALFLGGVERAFDANGRLDDGAVGDALRDVMHSLADWINAVVPQR